MLQISCRLGVMWRFLSICSFQYLCGTNRVKPSNCRSNEARNRETTSNTALICLFANKCLICSGRCPPSRTGCAQRSLSLAPRYLGVVCTSTNTLDSLRGLFKRRALRIVVLIAWIVALCEADILNSSKDTYQQMQKARESMRLTGRVPGVR